MNAFSLCARVKYPQKGADDPPELELKKVVSHYVDAGN